MLDRCKGILLPEQLAPDFLAHPEASFSPPGPWHCSFRSGFGITFPLHHFLEVVLPSLTPSAVLVSLVTKSRKSPLCTKTP